MATSHSACLVVSLSPFSTSLCREKLSLRKIKSGAVKPFFLSFMHDPPSQDVRLKLTGQNQFAKVSLNGFETCGCLLKVFSDKRVWCQQPGVEGLTLCNLPYCWTLANIVLGFAVLHMQSYISHSLAQPCSKLQPYHHSIMQKAAGYMYNIMVLLARYDS